jgi:hypothetical protein
MGTRIQTYRQDIGQVTLYVSDCAECGVVFGIPSTLERRRRDDGGAFYCPNGHNLVFTESEVDKARKRAEQAEREAQWARTSRDSWRDQAQAAERRRAAVKGQLTKVKKRVAAGVCPGCNRTFQDLARHMAGKHPDYATKEHA